VSTTS